MRRMTLYLIARLFLEKDARFSKIQYCPNNFDEIIGREIDYFNLIARIFLKIIASPSKK